MRAQSLKRLYKAYRPIEHELHDVRVGAGSPEESTLDIIVEIDDRSYYLTIHAVHAMKLAADLKDMANSIVEYSRAKQGKKL